MNQIQLVPPSLHRSIARLVLFLLLVLVQVVRAAWDRLQHGGSPEVSAGGIGIMALTLIVNLAVVWYETRAGHRLTSEVLLADAHHTRSDVLTTGAVLVALLAVWLGYPLLDPIAALLVAAFIALLVTYPHEVLIVMAYAYFVSGFVGTFLSRGKKHDGPVEEPAAESKPVKDAS